MSSDSNCEKQHQKWSCNLIYIDNAGQRFKQQHSMQKHQPERTKAKQSTISKNSSCRTERERERKHGGRSPTIHLLLAQLSPGPSLGGRSECRCFVTSLLLAQLSLHPSLTQLSCKEPFYWLAVSPTISWPSSLESQSSYRTGGETIEALSPACYGSQCIMPLFSCIIAALYFFGFVKLPVYLQKGERQNRHGISK